MLLAPALLAAIALGQSLPPWMTDQSKPEDIDIMLITFGPGDTLTEWWGHTALVAQDRRLNQARLYNFGMFGSDNAVDFVKNFAKGRLEFWVDDAGLGGTLAWYRQLNRDVRIQELDLSPEQAMSLAKALGTHVLPANRYYLYHHYNDNCSTRPRDMLDKAIGGQLLAVSNAPGRMTIRDHARRYAQVNPPMSVLLDFLQNDELDTPVTLKREAYLPDELERQVQALVITRPDGTKAPLVKKQWNWFEARRPATVQKPSNYVPWLLLIGGALGALGLGLGHLGRTGKRAPRIGLGLLTMAWGLGPGLLGTALFIMAMFTDHTVTYHNENLLFVNPVALALVPFGFGLARGKEVARTRLKWAWTMLAAGGVLDVVAKVLPMFDQANWDILALVLPVNLAMAAVWWLDARMKLKKAA